MIHKAAWLGMPDVIEELIQRGASIDSRDNEGMTALHWAAEKNQSQSIQTLLRLGADVSAVDFYGDTALDIAVGQGNTECADLLRVKTIFRNYQGYHG